MPKPLRKPPGRSRRITLPTHAEPSPPLPPALPIHYARDPRPGWTLYSSSDSDDRGKTPLYDSRREYAPAPSAPIYPPPTNSYNSPRPLYDLPPYRPGPNWDSSMSRHYVNQSEPNHAELPPMSRSSPGEVSARQMQQVVAADPRQAPSSPLIHHAKEYVSQPTSPSLPLPPSNLPARRLSGDDRGAIFFDVVGGANSKGSPNCAAASASLIHATEPSNPTVCADLARLASRESHHYHLRHLKIRHSCAENCLPLALYGRLPFYRLPLDQV